jgi:hypothetical protein
MLQEGASFGPYRIRHRLGAGGMGEVYLAPDVSLRTAVVTHSIEVSGEWRDEIRSAPLRSALPGLVAPHALPTLMTPPL